MRSSISLTASALVLSLGLTGCANEGTFGSICAENTALCVLGGVAVVGLGIWAISELDDDDDYSPSSPSGNFASDLRLKRDLHYFKTMPNGVKLYTFRYWNDERRFVGVIAQDLLKDERFRHAVSVDEKGYYLVSFAALGLVIPEADRPLYAEASEKAVEGL